MGKKAYDHTHQYMSFGSGRQYRCILPECTHIIHRDLLLGRKGECPYCQGVFTITDEHLRRKKLHCMHCTNLGKPVIKPVPEEMRSGEAASMDVFRKLLKEKGI